MAGSMNVKGYKLPLQVVHPITQEVLPVYVANYVLSDYGEGAVMGVPAHDDRDRAFAKLFDLPVKTVVTEDQHLTNSQQFDHLSVEEAIQQLLKDGKEQGWGCASTRYRLRDWLISRQRYWGAPVPAIHCSHCGVVPVPYEDLPVKLPSMDRTELHRMSGDDSASPLARMDLRIP